MSTRSRSAAPGPARRSGRDRDAARAARRALALAAALAFAVVSFAAQGQAPAAGAPAGQPPQDETEREREPRRDAADEATAQDGAAQDGAQNGEQNGAAQDGAPGLGDFGAGEDAEPERPRFGAPDAEAELPAGGGPAFLASVLTVGGARDEGFLVGDQELEDTSYLVTPTLLFLHRPSPRSELAVGYEPEIERFERHPELDAVHHAAGAVYRFELSDAARVAIGASLLDGEDPSRHLDGLILLLPRGPYRQGRVHLDLERRWRHTALLLHLGRTDTEIEPASDPLEPGGDPLEPGDDPLEPGLLGPGIDQTDDTVGLALEQAVGERTTLTASYSWVDPTPGRGAVVPAGLPAAVLTEPIQTLLLGFGRRLSRRVTLDLAAGLLDDGLEPLPGEDRYALIAAGEIRRRGDDFSLRLRYDRSLVSLAPSAPGVGGPAGTPLPSAALRDSLAHTATAGFEVRPGPWLRWEQLVRATRAELADGDDLETVALTSRLVVPAGRRFGVYAQVDHFEQQGGPGVVDDGAGEDGRARTRWGIGLIVGVGGPPAAWGIREEPALLLRTIRPDRY